MLRPSQGKFGGLPRAPLFENHSMMQCLMSMENNKKNYEMSSVTNVHKLHPPKESTGPVLYG